MITRGIAREEKAAWEIPLFKKVVEEDVYENYYLN